MVQIQFISPEETYPIRHKILRPNQSLRDCQYPGDLDESTFHVGGFCENSLVSIASYYVETDSSLRNHGNLLYRLRGMATLSEYRGRGIGSALIKFSEEYLKELGSVGWWCNARISACPYYKNLGLTQVGDVFDIEPIGPHMIMFKEL